MGERYPAGPLPPRVSMIVKAAERLPRQVSDSERAEAEENLVAKAAAGMNAKNLRRAAKRMLGTSAT